MIYRDIVGNSTKFTELTSLTLSLDSLIGFLRGQGAIPGVSRVDGVGVNRKYILLGVDLLWVALSPFFALLVRDHFAPRPEALTATVAYACLSVGIAAVIFPLAGLNRALWRYTSLAELLKLQLAVTATVLLALLGTFAHTRLLDISRSLPLLQWFFLVALMTATRLAIRVWRERTDGAPQFSRTTETEYVLIVGVNQLAEVYARAMVELAPHKFSIVGLLANGSQMPGRLLGSHKVLGAPQDISKVAEELEVHGTWLDRVVVTIDPKELLPAARQALFDFEKSTDIKVDWLSELLGFGSHAVEAAERGGTTAGGPPAPTPRRQNSYPKRLLDLGAASFLLIATAPLFAVLMPLIALDVGLPIVFWQHRPGHFGRHFKLYKFRTMGAPHDESGNRIPDESRVSMFGELLRRSRLDELPQLYNVLVGEMSLVGPRPLIATDHEPGTHERLLVRPGLTGWAQVNGGRKLSTEDKAALDIWYVTHLSLALDLKIALRTILLLFLGERVNQEAVLAAQKGCARVRETAQQPKIAAKGAKVAAAIESAI